LEISKIMYLNALPFSSKLKYCYLAVFQVSISILRPSLPPWILINQNVQFLHYTSDSIKIDGLLDLPSTCLDPAMYIIQMVQLPKLVPGSEFNHKPCQIIWPLTLALSFCTETVNSTTESQMPNSSNWIVWCNLWLSNNQNFSSTWPLSSETYLSKHPALSIDRFDLNE
jgi:hypothetical protein